MELNKKRTGIALKLYELTEKIVQECGYVLYDVEYIPGSSTLRVFIMDKETDTALIEDCVKVDRAFTPYCESLDWIPEDFVLEVSSPGVFRNLKTREHFNSAVEEYISLTLLGNLTSSAGVELSKSVLKSKKLRGMLVSVKEDRVILEIENQEIEVLFEQIKKAQLDPNL